MARPRKVSAMLAAARADQRRVGDWMAFHHAELLDQLGPGRIDWRPVMDVIASLDLRDEHGQAVTRDTAARTWARVRRRAVDRQAQEAMRAKSSLRPGEIAPGVRPLAFVNDPGTRPFLELDIAPARPREAAPADRGPLPAGADGHATGLLKTAIDSLGAARVPMPKPISRGS